MTPGPSLFPQPDIEDILADREARCTNTHLFFGVSGLVVSVRSPTSSGVSVSLLVVPQARD